MAALLLPAAAASLAKPPDYKVLARRLAKASASTEGSASCLLLDTLLPRQRVELQFGPPISGALKAARDGRTLVVLGMNHKTGQILKRGVEVRIESMSPYRASHGYFSSHSTSAFRGFTAFDTALVGGRRFELAEEPAVWPPDTPVFDASIRWLPSPSEEESPPAAVVIAEQLGPLVDEWLGLVRSGQRERSEGQLDKLLADLGPMPDAEDALYRIFWIAALINPSPALGVALECRATLLESNDALYSCEMVRYVLRDSIKRLKKMPPGPFEVERPPHRRQ